MAIQLSAAIRGPCQEADFGWVLLNTQPANQTVTIQNPYPDAVTYTISAVPAPFTLVSGGSGNMSANGTATLVFGFQPQTVIDPFGGVGYGASPQEIFDTNVTVTIEDPVKSAYTVSDIALNAVLYGPQPTNVLKRESTWAEVFVHAPGVGTFFGVGDGEHLFTTIAFNSTSGYIGDLYGKIIVREVLTVQPPGVSPCVSCQPVTINNFPNGCDFTNEPIFQLNPPWQPGARPVSNPQLMFPDPTGSPPWFYYPTTMYFMDGHATYTFLPKLQAGTWTVLQIYEWTAPWLITTCSDGSPRTNWFNLMVDEVTRTSP